MISCDFRHVYHAMNSRLRSNKLRHRAEVVEVRGQDLQVGGGPGPQDEPRRLLCLTLPDRRGLHGAGNAARLPDGKT